MAVENTSFYDKNPFDGCQNEHGTIQPSVQSRTSHTTAHLHDISGHVKLVVCTLMACSKNTIPNSNKCANLFSSLAVFTSSVAQPVHMNLRYVSRIIAKSQAVEWLGLVYRPSRREISCGINLFTFARSEWRITCLCSPVPACCSKRAPINIRLLQTNLTSCNQRRLTRISQTEVGLSTIVLLLITSISDRTIPQRVIFLLLIHNGWRNLARHAVSYKPFIRAFDACASRM